MRNLSQIAKKTIIAMTILVFTSCQGSFSTLQSRLENFIQQTDNNFLKMSKADWEKSDTQIEEFKAEFETVRTDMTESEIVYINELFGKYSALSLKHTLNKGAEAIKDMTDQLKGAVKELIDSNEKNN